MKLLHILPPPPATITTKCVVTLADEERTALRKLVTTGRSAARARTHAQVLLKADAAPSGPGWTDTEIAAAIPVSLRTIARVRRAFVEHGVDAALHPRPAPPRPRKLDGRAEAHLLALACSLPPDGEQRWTLQLLTERFVALEVSPPVSDETVRRTLKQTTSSPTASSTG
jgi:transposase